MGAGAANLKPSQQSSQPSGPPNMGGKGAAQGMPPKPMPNMGGKGNPQMPGQQMPQPYQPQPYQGQQLDFYKQMLSGQNPQPGQQIPFSPGQSIPQQPQGPMLQQQQQMNQARMQELLNPSRLTPEQTQQQVQQAQQQMPSMGGKGGPQQLPQGMGGYMQQMAMNKYAMQPQFNPYNNMDMGQLRALQQATPYGSGAQGDIARAMIGLNPAAGMKQGGIASLAQ